MKTNNKIIAILFALLLQTGICFSQGIINPGFENVTNVSGTDIPDSWHSLSGFGMSAKPLANSGSWSLAVWNWYFYAPGIAVNGSTGSFESYKAGTPYNQKADKLTGYYYFEQGSTQSTNDTGFIAVLLKKYNSGSETIDTVGFGLLKLVPGTSSGYLPFELNIVDLMPGTDPDSVVVHIQSSYSGFCDNASDGTCLYLYVDDLALESPSGITPVGFENDKINIYPNPATTEINMSWDFDAELVSIYTIDGKCLLNQNIHSMKNTILNTSHLTEGMYFVVIENENGLITREKIIIQK